LTGELTLNGKILHTTGIKEKVIVAQREKIEEVVMPIDNMPDV
jgi:ATP-dependent Lon protease